VSDPGAQAFARIPALGFIQARGLGPVIIGPDTPDRDYFA